MLRPWDCLQWQEKETGKVRAELGTAGEISTVLK